MPMMVATYPIFLRWRFQLAFQLVNVIFLELETFFILAATWHVLPLHTKDEIVEDMRRLHCTKYLLGSGVLVYKIDAGR